MKYTLWFGFTVSVYGSVEIEANTQEELEQAIEAVLDDGGGDTRVEVDWDSADDYRAVSLRDDRGNSTELPESIYM